MTFCYQNRCDDIRCSPCDYQTVYNCRTYDCGSPCNYQSYRSLCSYRDCYPSFSSRFCYPYSSCYTRRFSYGTCYPRYPCDRC